jgi:hypothetical protein
MLFNRVGDPDLLAEAVSLHREAVAAAGAAVQSLAERTRRADLLAEAIQALRTAAVISPRGHPDRAGCLSNLGID